jgi:malate dehydrogenase (oxaloacetate-decarboxylating)
MVEKEKVLEEHRKNRGKIEIIPKVRLVSSEDLSTFYTPGVAYPSLAIKEDKDLSFEYTGRSNTIAIVSDGTRILGLGNIGPEAGLPVMEGKAALFKKFGGVDAVPICIGTTDEDEIVAFLKNISVSFGAINVEDIESPKAFNVVNRAQNELDIPVFHDDQQGTAVVVVAALINAIKLSGKSKNAKIVVNGAGTAGIGVVKLAMHAGFNNIIVLDSRGAIYEGRDNEQNEFKREIASKTNHSKERGNLSEIARGADVLIGLSKKGIFTKEIISGMNEKPIIFALANPEPEIDYEDAKAAGAYIVATGRSDRPNQVNNVVAFPGIMRGLLDVRAKKINMEMLYAASLTISKGVGNKLNTEFILNSVFDKEYPKITSEIAAAVGAAAIDSGVARISKDKKEIKKDALGMIKKYARFERRFFKKSNNIE